MKARLRLTIAAFGLAIFNVSIATVQAQFNYTINNGTITITGYTGPGGAVTISSTINGLPVTSIGTGAFQISSSLTSVTIPGSVADVGGWAFEWCTSLTSVMLGNGVTSIGNLAFYTVVIRNVLGAVTSAPAMLNVIAAVERRPVPGIKAMGEIASLLNVDYASSLSPAPNWTTLGSVSLTGTPEYCFDVALPLPPQRFYRAWQTGTPGVRPSLDLHLVPAITLTGNIGGSVRLDYINQFGPTDTWVTLATVPLTNTTQLYFDVSAFRQPTRLYRLVP